MGEAYQTDVPVRLLQAAAALLEYPIRRLNPSQDPRLPHPVSMGLALVLFYSVAGSFMALFAGVFLPGSPNVQVPLAEDYPQIFLMIAAPVAIVLAMNFYRSVFEVLRQLHRRGIISERPGSEFLVDGVLAELHKRLNSPSWQLLCAVASVAAAGLIIWHAEAAGERWVAELPIWASVWGAVMVMLGWWVTLFFFYKCAIIILTIRLLTDERKFVID